MADCTRNKSNFWVYLSFKFFGGKKRKKWSWVWWKWETFRNCFKVHLNQNELGGVKTCRVIASGFVHTSSTIPKQSRALSRMTGWIWNWKGILWLTGGKGDYAPVLSCLLSLGKLFTFLRRASDTSKTCLFSGLEMGCSQTTIAHHWVFPKWLVSLNNVGRYKEQ